MRLVKSYENWECKVEGPVEGLLDLHEVNEITLNGHI